MSSEAISSIIMKPSTIATCLLLFSLSINIAAQQSGTTPTESDGTDDEDISDVGLYERSSADDITGYSASTTTINSENDSHADDYERNDDDDDDDNEEEYDKDNENDEDDDSTEQATTTDLLEDNKESSLPFDDLINANATLESSNLLLLSTPTSPSWLSEVISTKAEMKDGILAGDEALQTSQGGNLSNTSTPALRPSTGPTLSDTETSGAKNYAKNLQAETFASPKYQDAQSTLSPYNKVPSTFPAQHPLLTTLGKGVTKKFASLIKSHPEEATEKKGTTPIIPAVRLPVNKGRRRTMERANQVKAKQAEPMPLRSIESNLHVSGAAANQKSNKTAKANNNKSRNQNTNNPGPPGPKGPPGPQGPPGPPGSPGAPGDCKCQDAGPAMRMQAAASAVLTKHFGPDKDVIVPFDLELTDLADNYDNTSGVFFCSIPGTYVISLYLMSHPGSKVNARIFVNSRPVAALWADDNKNAGFYPSSSIQTISRLEFGDQVYVMLVDGGYGDSWVHANYNVFTVFLLYEDMFQR